MDFLHFLQLPDSVLPLNNVAFAYNAMGQNEKGVSSLKKALKLEPDNAATNLNLGMLLGKIGRVTEAEKAFRTAFKSDPNSAASCSCIQSWCYTCW